MIFQNPCTSNRKSDFLAALTALEFLFIFKFEFTVSLFTVSILAKVYR